MKKSKNNCQKQPFNINISFNIHPKHVMQSQHNSHLKVANNIFNSSQPSPPNHRFTHENGTRNRYSHAKSSHSGSHKGNNKTIELSEMGQRQLDKLKKTFLKKINNIDINLPAQTIQLEPLEQEQKSGRSSLMSAKMEECPKDNNISSKGHYLHAYHLDIHHFQEAKSKVLPSHEFSKMLGPHTNKKNRTEKKYSISQTKPLSKFHTQEKWQSCVTEGKIKSARQAPKKKKKQKQQSLKEKLQRFKVDMMKLAVFYEENEVLKTKMSSEYYNMRSRQISKDNVYQVSEAQEHEKASEMRKYQVNLQKNKVEKEIQHSQEKINQFTETYRYLKEKNANDCESQSDKEETSNIINYYKNLSLNLNNRPQKIEIIDCISEGTQKINVPNEKFTPRSSIQKLEELDKTKAQNNMLMLNNFVQFIEQKYQGDESVKNSFQTLLSQFLQKSNHPNIDNKQQQIQPQEDTDSVEERIFVGIDDKINLQLIAIPFLTNNIASNYALQPEQQDQLEKWEKSYNEELLKMKGKMWREYRNIRNEVQSRISSGSNIKPITTRKSKKTVKIMKCLSEKILRNRIEPLDDAQQIWKKKSSQSSEEQENLSPKDNFIYQDSNENLELSMHQSQEVEEEQNYASARVVFNEMRESSKKDDMLIQEQLSAKSEQILVPISMKHLSIDDKQDIFEFIFLDLCIELYQDFVEKEGKKRSKNEVQASQRILNHVKSYIEEDKKIKANQPIKRIGISTNINTIRLFLSQLKAYLMEACESNSRIDKFLEKLNTPLGPTNKEMLKSLRMAVFEDSNIRDDLDPQYDESDLLVLRPSWFTHFENQVICIQKLEFPKYYESEEKEKQRVNFLRNCTHIHHKAIFDALNENLDYSRVFGIWGEPFAWKKKPSFNHIIKEKQIQSVINKSAAEVMRATTFACGLMVSKQESLLKDLADNEPYVKRLQDERIYKFLQDYVIDLQQKWFFHDDEEAETLMELSHVVWTTILDEIVHDLSVFQSI